MIMKKLLIFNLLALFMVSITMNSCREPFETGFDDVLIINQPPLVSGLDTLTYSAGFGSIELDLSSFISDQENDDLIITAESANAGVATISLSGTVLTIEEVGPGQARISLTIDDGVERDDLVRANFVVVIAEQTVEYKFFVDLVSITNGTLFNDYTLLDGTVVGTAEASAGSSRIVQNGVLEWTTDEWDVMSLTFASPIDLSIDATFEFEYADLWSDEFGITVIDVNGGEAGFGWEEAPFAGELVLNAPSFNKFSFDLADYTGTEVDLSQVTAIYIEKWGATESKTFKFRNLGIGISKPLFELNFTTLANGTVFNDLTLDDGTVIGTAEASEGSERVIQNGILEWTTDEWDVMSITFPAPIDLTSNPVFSMEYADLWSDEFGITVIDKDGGEAGFGWEEAPFAGAMILADASFNTFSFDLSEYTGADVDLTAVSAIYIEKWGATEAKTFKVKEIAIGK